MKTLYLDCGMGAAGDMLTAALLELLSDPDEFLKEFHALQIPGVVLTREKSMKCGIVGTHVEVQVDAMVEDDTLHEHTHTTSHGHSDEHFLEHGHSHGHRHSLEHGHSHEHEHPAEHAHSHTHRGLHEIEHIISRFPLPEKVKQDILDVYHLIAEAESHAHDVPIAQIHFHEVGTMDAIADVTAVCMLIDKLQPEEIIVSPVHVGWGQVRCAHGILPVPAPATAYILRNVPVYGGTIKGELCTPTGAALLKHFAHKFGEMPAMSIQNIGYGMGKKDFEKANCVRAMLGERFDTASKTSSEHTVIEFSCNVDDMTGEAIGFATERLFEEGALDVYTIPIGMKKSRPATQIRVMCKEEDKANLIRLIFKYTTTIGVRETLLQRHTLSRTIETANTPLGDVRYKKSTGYGVSRSKYEYDDLSKLAKKHNLSIDDVMKLLP